MQQAMHATGIVAPAGKDGDCGHTRGKARDGRCLGCKREADQRTYRKRQYVQALAELVTRGVAVTATTSKGTEVWKYAGPAYGYVPPKLPALPFECDPEVVEHFRALMGRLPGRGDGSNRQLAATFQVATDQAQRGSIYTSHTECAVCLAVHAENEAAHSEDSTFAVTARQGGREEGHHDCWFCLRIDEAADVQRRMERQERERQRREEEEAAAAQVLLAERRARHAQARRNGTYAYVDGRRIQRDGSLCDCSQCDERQAARHATEPTSMDRFAEGLRSGTIRSPGGVGTYTFPPMSNVTGTTVRWEVFPPGERMTPDGDTNEESR